MSKIDPNKCWSQMVFSTFAARKMLAEVQRKYHDLYIDPVPDMERAIERDLRAQEAEYWKHQK